MCLICLRFVAPATSSIKTKYQLWAPVRSRHSVRSARIRRARHDRGRHARRHEGARRVARLDRPRVRAGKPDRRKATIAGRPLKSRYRCGGRRARPRAAGCGDLVRRRQSRDLCSRRNPARRLLRSRRQSSSTPPGSTGMGRVRAATRRVDGGARRSRRDGADRQGRPLAAGLPRRDRPPADRIARPAEAPDTSRSTSCIATTRRYPSASSSMPWMGRSAGGSRPSPGPRRRRSPGGRARSAPWTRRCWCGRRASAGPRAAPAAARTPALHSAVGLVVDQHEDLLGRQRLAPPLDQVLQAVVVPEGACGVAIALGAEHLAQPRVVRAGLVDRLDPLLPGRRQQLVEPPGRRSARGPGRGRGPRRACATCCGRAEEKSSLLITTRPCAARTSSTISSHSRCGTCGLARRGSARAAPSSGRIWRW